MVITKDLSRLGRDMTESSYYAETYFPENQIHYIAISDNFDSNEVNIMAPFQFAMNDVYLRDTSRKIKQVINQKRTKGEYCACPPFGYMKNKDGTALEPDPKTAPIVQKIFAMAHDGKSARAIATALTEYGDITPLKYRVLYRDNFGAHHSRQNKKGQSQIKKETCRAGRKLVHHRKHAHTACYQRAV